MRFAKTTIALGLCLFAFALPRALHPAEAPAGTCHVLLVTGLPGTPVHARRYRDWVTRLRGYLVNRAGVAAASITVLSGDAKFGGDLVTGEATPDTITGTVRELAGEMKPADQFVLALFGHSSAADGEVRCGLRGPDLSHVSLSESLKSMRAGNQVVLDFTPASGVALQTYAAENRVVVAATSVDEDAESVFAEFLLRGLESGRADGEGAPAAGRKDGTVSLLEAYNWATHQTSLWVRRVRKGAGDDWIVTGRESVEVFKHLYNAPDGTPGARRLSARSNAKVDDPVVPFLTTGAEAKAATGRRLLSEHATLDDTGEGLGKAAVRGNVYKPLAGQRPGEVGARARKVVLGRAALFVESDRSDRSDGSDRPNRKPAGEQEP
jgi:hypothetical protein